MPGISGAISTPVSIPARVSSPTASSRARGFGVCGSVARHARSSSVGTDTAALKASARGDLAHQLESRSSSGDFVSTEHGLAASRRASQMPGISR